MRKISSDKLGKKNIIEVLKFGIIGVLNTLLDFVLFFLFFNLIGINKNLAQVMSTTIAMIHSYLWNRYWTFQQTGGVRLSEMWKFVIVNLISMGVNILCLNLFYDLWHLERIAQWLLSAVGADIVLSDKMGVFFCKILATPFVLAVNFVGNKIWVFRKKKDCKTSDSLL